MLMPHPETLRKLVEEYEALTAQQPVDGLDELSRRLQDLAYTLCVSTGTREVHSALAAAHRQLAGYTGGLAVSPGQAAPDGRIYA
ncbi:DUF5133 domain-containing protein [Streptomyces sp. ALI-76-A]|jgi:phosphoglycolate phosphatase-like HAD superfamily hydrolase|uniref:DUF5133 domain-containing protein n=1 Tax=Streptomyces sp. ALI-76-A TaxID=3025736 RepID=UPI00256ED367|nr:DUF5133 domain-containing protein [Streptomyces sp. ALI-76-A]MDL5199288.1 DUF5133 domain-containing protein [Streptomyces sp. ALI-76-A]